MFFRFSLAPFLALFAFAISAGVVWLAHIEAGEMTLDRRPPLVKASSAPLKRSPDDPGGSAVADLGGVRDLMRDQPAEIPAEIEERLLPTAEQPVPPAAAATGAGETPSPEGRSPANDALEALVAEIRTDETGEDDGTAASNEAPIAVTPAEPIPQGSTAGEPAPADNAAPEEAEVAAARPTFEATESGRYRVQLAAVRDENGAQQAWTVFQAQLGPFISGLKPFFERAETNNGTFYRVQVGPFGQSEEADRLCVELKKRNASCFVVAR